MFVTVRLLWNSKLYTYKYHTVNYIYINVKFLVMTLYIFVSNYFEIMLEIVNLYKNGF